MRLVLSSTALVLAAAGAARAEPERARTSSVCVLGFGMPRCRTIPVLDVGLRYSPGFEPIGDSHPLSISFEGGMIVNLGHHSVGLVAGFLFDADYPAGTVRARYRFWPHWTWPIEGSAGVLIDRGSPHDVGTGLVLEVATSFVDVAAVTATVEMRGDDATHVLVGARFGLQTLALPSYLLPNW
jgi:hypothetical protein